MCSLVYSSDVFQLWVIFVVVAVLGTALSVCHVLAICYAFSRHIQQNFIKRYMCEGLLYVTV